MFYTLLIRRQDGTRLGKNTGLCGRLRHWEECDPSQHMSGAWKKGISWHWVALCRSGRHTEAQINVIVCIQYTDLKGSFVKKRRRMSSAGRPGLQAQGGIQAWWERPAPGLRREASTHGDQAADLFLPGLQLESEEDAPVNGNRLERAT